MRGWTSFILRFRTPVILLWSLASLLGLWGAHDLTGRLTTSLSVPGSDSAKADRILQGAFGENYEGTFTVLLHFKNATKQELLNYEEKVVQAAATIPSARVSQQKAVGGYLASSISTDFSLTRAAVFTDQLRSSLKSEGLAAAQVTGPPAIYRDVTPVLSRDLHRGEIVAVVIAFTLLILLFGLSWSAFMPLIFAGANIALTLGLIDLVAHKILMVLYIPNIVELIGLGLAIDYSLLIVHRFYRAKEEGAQDPIAQTMATAGRTVLLSGTTVAVGMLALLIVPVPFVKSLALAGAIVPIVAMLAAITLQPALLTMLPKERVNRVRVWKFGGLLGESEKLSAFFERVARFVIRQPLKILACSLTLVIAVSSAILWLEVTPSSLTKIPATLESSKALTQASSQIGSGIITPFTVVLDLGSTGSSDQPMVAAAQRSLALSLSRDKESFIVASGLNDPYVDSSHRYLRLYVVGNHELGSTQSNALVSRIRSQYLPMAHFPRGSQAYVGGAPAQGVDLLRAIKSSIPLIALLLFGIIFILLLRAFRSILLPIKAILLDGASIAFAYGAVVIAFKYGVAHSVLGSYQLPRIEAWVLLFLFALLFGLSMDYEVFIVSRIREAWLTGLNLEDAIIEGVAQTGGVVSAAAIILVSALTGLVLGAFAGLQELGIGLAVGILVDATIIRLLILPATMVLFGRWNWWLPTFKPRTSR